MSQYMSPNIASPQVSQRLSMISGTSPRTVDRFVQNHTAASQLGFDAPWPSLDNLPDLPIQRHQLTDQRKYESIVQHFTALCLQPPSFFARFRSSSFPPLEVFNYLVMLYFRHINRVITVFHFPTMALHSSHWIVALCVAAEGCQYLKGDTAEPYTRAMREFLRRALVMLVRLRHIRMLPLKAKRSYRKSPTQSVPHLPSLHKRVCCT